MSSTSQPNAKTENRSGLFIYSLHMPDSSISATMEMPCLLGHALSARDEEALPDDTYPHMRLLRNAFTFDGTHLFVGHSSVNMSAIAFASCNVAEAHPLRDDGLRDVGLDTDDEAKYQPAKLTILLHNRKRYVMPVFGALYGRTLDGNRDVFMDRGDGFTLLSIRGVTMNLNNVLHWSYGLCSHAEHAELVAALAARGRAE